MENPSKIVVSSAPGKIILFGEHAVVLGKTAISAALDLRTYVHLESTQNNTIQVNLPKSEHFPSTFSWKLDDFTKFDINSLPPLEDPEVTPSLKNFIENLICGDGYSIFRPAMEAFLILYILIARGRKCGVIVTIKSQVPIGVGLGSSAAFNTSLSAGLLKFFSYQIGDDPTTGTIQNENGKKIINKYAFIGEKLMHGNPSGIDNTTSTVGGVVAFTAGQFEMLTDIPAIKLIITNTKVSRNTKLLVQKVGSLHKMFPHVIVPLLDSIHNISQHVIKIIKEYSLNKSDEALLEVESQLEIFISISHNVLGALGVGHPSLDKICLISSQNYMQSKLTGAGGGGTAFTLIKKNMSPNRVSTMISQLEEAGFECFSVNIGGGGVKIHPENFIPELE